MKTRADLLLVARGLAASRARARAEIAAGLVFADGRPVGKPGELLPPEAALELRGTANPYVSRGGLKLAAALERFGVAVEGRQVRDVGAATGGFTEACLARGAAHVTSVDVGRDQLHPRLRGHPRLTLHEGTDIRSAAGLPPADLVVIDVSFIGLAKVLAAALAGTAPGADLVALVKPQFEVGRAALGKGGIVTDRRAQEEAVAGAIAAVEAQAGWRVVAICESPILGGDGNREIFLHARRG